MIITHIHTQIAVAYTPYVPTNTQHCSTASRPPPPHSPEQSQTGDTGPHLRRCCAVTFRPTQPVVPLLFPTGGERTTGKGPPPPPRPIEHRCALGVAATWNILIGYIFCMFQSTGAKQPTGQPPPVQQRSANTNGWVIRRRIMIMPFEYRSDT